MKKVVTAIISLYQKTLSPDTGVFAFRPGTTCTFYPTCSEYTKQAVTKYGAIKGIFMGCRRILRCHPWQTSHIDPLP